MSWMKPAHNREGNLLYSVCKFKCQSLLEPLSQTHPKIIFIQIFGHLTSQSRLYLTITVPIHEDILAGISESKWSDKCVHTKEGPVGVIGTHMSWEWHPWMEAIWHRYHGMARWACCPCRDVAWWGISEAKQDEQSVHTQEGSAWGTGTQNNRGCKESTKGEDKVSIVMAGLHTGRLIKYVTSHWSFPHMDTLLLGLLCPVPATHLCAQLSCFAPPHDFRTELFSKGEGKGKEAWCSFHWPFLCYFASITANALWQVVHICCPHFLLFSH